MPKYDINIKAFGDRAILIEWPQRIDERILDDIISFSKHLEVVLTNSLLDYTSAYASILLRYKDSIIFDIERHGGLDERLHLPRKSSPSLSTPARSVAIGGNQTGIYPIQSPGGWHVIGRTPIHIFNIELTPPTPIQQGDYIKFYSITLEQYEALMRG